ncbi:MAG TPA: type II secretion system minor pseudopilin GspI [Gammaproteobacteria bacterium]|nr:type II secretion system minor pseudopilin GspI [Gammaproteobacteria bacterium]HRP88036.1 type II secretion system minor pseudopilin GspI [Gammaproteobacteria bacterium]
MKRRRQRGFTLLEVMVAMAIVSIGLIAVFNAIIQMAHSTSTLRERALADWIAMNQISEIRLSGEFPDVGNFNDTVEFAGLPWRWEARISETGVENLRRIDMAVAREETPDDAVTVMAGFVSRGVSGPALRVDWWGVGQPPAGPGEQEREPDPQAPGDQAPREEEEED